MNNSFNTDLAIVLKERGGRLPIARGEDELEFINRWIASDLTKNEASPPRKPFSIKEMIKECTKCGQVAERKYPAGTGFSRVMVILNSPRLLSRVERNLYRDESISMMKKMIELLGVNFGDVYITNLIKCEVDDALSKTSSIVKNCEEILLKEIEEISPAVAVLFGDIIPLQKIVKSTKGVYWFNIDHPVTLIKNPDLKRGAWNTLRNVKQHIDEFHSGDK